MSRPEVIEVDGVTRSVIRFSFNCGSNKSSNPQRPTVAWGSGSLEINDYRTDVRKRVTLKVDGVTYIEGWIQNERFNIFTGISRYEIEGLLYQRARLRKEVTQQALSANASDEAVIALLADALGEATIEARIASTPLSRYSFEGPAGGYASRFSQVAGALPYATPTGGFGLKDPTNPPGELDAILDQGTYRIRNIRTEFDQDQLRNSALVPNIDRTGLSSDLSARAENFLVYSGSRTSGHTFDLPELEDGETYENIRTHVFERPFELSNGTYGMVKVYDENGVASSVPATGGGTLFESPITGPTEQSDGSLRYVIDVSTDNPVLYYGDEGDRHQASGWATDTSDGDPGQAAEVYRIDYTADFIYNIATEGPQRDIRVTNQESIRLWDPRELTFPTWFSPDAVPAIQERVDNLGKQRLLRIVDLYIDQRNKARNAEVAGLRAGHFIGLPYTGTIVFVMNTEWTTGNSVSGLKRLTCIDTGIDFDPDVPNNALTWRGNVLAWRGYDGLIWNGS